MKSMSKKVIILLIIIAILSMVVVQTTKSYAATTYTQSLKPGIFNFPKELQALILQRYQIMKMLR